MRLQNNNRGNIWKSVTILTKIKEQQIDKLLNVILTINDKKELKDFLRGILTPTELEDIAKRLEIVVRLLKGQTQRKIADDLGVGIATVTRGARELKQNRFKFLKRLMKTRGNLIW